MPASLGAGAHRPPQPGGWASRSKAIPGPPVTPVVGEGEGFSSWLSLRDNAGQRFDPVLITPRAASRPAATRWWRCPAASSRSRWVTDPSPSQAALALPAAGPDTTTEPAGACSSPTSTATAFRPAPSCPACPWGRSPAHRGAHPLQTAPRHVGDRSRGRPHGLYPREAPPWRPWPGASLPSQRRDRHPHLPPTLLLGRRRQGAVGSTAAQGYTSGPAGLHAKPRARDHRLHRIHPPAPGPGRQAGAPPAVVGQRRPPCGPSRSPRVPASSP